MPEGRTVLVVEDDTDLRLAFRQALTRAGFRVQEAATGRLALLQIDQQQPDVIVLDLVLPGIPGLEVHETITAHARTRHIPIVIVTGSTISLDHVDVACVLRKPVATQELIGAVTRCLDSGAPGV